MALDQLVITLRNKEAEYHDVTINIFKTNLALKWYNALNQLLANNFHLEKNYLWHGWADHERNGTYLCEQINKTFDAINNSNLDYPITKKFVLEDILIDTNDPDEAPFDHDKLNELHRYFEDLQGTTQELSQYYIKADHTTKWHIRQLNNL